MKRMKYAFLLLFITSAYLYAQVPPGFNYQAIARDGKGNLIAERGITAEVTILAGSENGIEVWKEVHKTSTNSFGMFSIVVCGDDELRTGGLASTVTEIPWASGNNFISIRIDAGEGAVDLGATRIRSVPYSLVSASTVQKSNTLSIQPSVPLGDGEALFIVRRSDGYPIFGVYEDGVRVFTDTSSVNGKGLKGGFAVGGYNSGKKGIGETYLSVSPDSTRIYVKDISQKGLKGGFAVGGYTTGKGIPMTLMSLSQDSARIYVNDIPGKGLKGGFAVGGYNSGKGLPREYLRVTQDSTRVYLNTEPRKGLKGGFAVGGYTTGKANTSTFMNLEPENYFIGHNSGQNVTTGLYNSVMGYESGLNITEGYSNSFIGYQSGFKNTTGTGNLFLGYQTGFNNIEGTYNTFIGYLAGYENFQGVNNTFMGSFSGRSNVGGSFNTFVGDSTGYSNTYGYSNTFLGTAAGYSNTTGFSNVMLGTRAGYNNNNGGYNVFIGHLTGSSNVDAGSNVFIGTEAGVNSTGGWNNIYLGTESGAGNIDGEGNVFAGYQSGMNNEHGTRNVFLGNWSGINEKGSDKLYITNWDSDSTNSLIWGDFATRRIRFNHEVGINMYPAGPLSVNNDFDAGYINVYGDGNGFDYSGIILNANDTADRYSFTISHTDAHGFYIGQRIDQNYYPRISIDSTGNVGINAGAGDQSFLVADSDGNSDLWLRGSGNGYDYAQLILESMGDGANTHYSLGHNVDHNFHLVYFDGNIYQSRFRVDEQGFIAVNNWEVPTQMLDVNGNARFRAVGSATSANDLRITADGTLTTSTSDKRLKTDFQPLMNSLDKVLHLQGVNFQWKDNESGKRDVGLVAQDVSEVFPEAVFVNENDGYMGVNYSRFPALLIEAIKEQQGIIDKQQSQIEELLLRVEQLERD